jgi:hypothetical protein
MSTRIDTPGRAQRSALLAATFAVILVCFWAFGGNGVAGNSVSANQYQYGGKVTICHDGRTKQVPQSKLTRYLADGATLGPCPRAR